MLVDFVGLIDGTKIRMSHPSGEYSNQGATYSGHKRFHVMSYQTVKVPDGLIISFYRPLECRQPDSVMYGCSGLDKLLEDNFAIGGMHYCINGDASYVQRERIQTAFPRNTSTVEQKMFIDSMKSVRTSFE